MQLNSTIYYSVEDVAQTLGRSKDWPWAPCRAKKVPHHKRGRHYVFTAADIEAIDKAIAQVAVDVVP